MILASDSSTRIVSWNLGHQTHLADIHPRFLDAVRALAPDILVLNEYGHDETERAPLVKSLADADIGLIHHLVSEQIMCPAKTPGGKPLPNNQVSVASRYYLRRGDLHGPWTADNGGGANFLHVVIDDLSIELVGMRVPAYGTEALQLYWDAFSQLANSVIDRKICFIGDFNADPDSARHIAAKRFANFRDHGWHIPKVEDNWSFKSGTRIDHALASSSFPHIAVAQYVDSYDDLTLAGSTHDAIFDHAALVIDLASKGVGR